MSVYRGDCLAWLRSLEDESVDAVVTDPPYGLSKPPKIEDVLQAWLDGVQYEHGGGGFMGHEWDAFVPGPAVWREVARVLKPGGHAVVFAGTRTVDVMGVALRLAGLEVRDLGRWCYWSGFPKSMDISKAIDRQDAVREQETRRYRFTAWVRSTGLTSRQIDDATGTNMGGHYTTAASQPAVMTREHLEAVRDLIDEVPSWVEQEVDRRTIESDNMKARKAVGTKRSGIANPQEPQRHTIGAGKPVVVDITAPATPEAEAWAGWGTALKPAGEPWLLVRKPMRGTTVAQVLSTGTGALNIDGCRYPDGDDAWPGPSNSDFDDGRWPVNLYACPKASRAERERGCDELPARSGADAVKREPGSAGLTPRAGAGRSANAVRNHHPTVKPVRLMRWLVRLVTPPGGVVIDPYLGSGTTGIAATLEGVRWAGAELLDDHADIAEARIAHAARWPEAWGDTTPGGGVSTDERATLERRGQLGMFGGSDE